MQPSRSDGSPAAKSATASSCGRQPADYNATLIIQPRSGGRSAIIAHPLIVCLVSVWDDIEDKRCRRFAAIVFGTMAFRGLTPTAKRFRHYVAGDCPFKKRSRRFEGASNEGDRKTVNVKSFVIDAGSIAGSDYDYEHRRCATEHEHEA